ncbi:MAG: hypothetical protein JWQ75_3529 [Pseudarthrobacter sp.]|nr:hypothetical protein [Pseudarthrobacter sp.]
MMTHKRGMGRAVAASVVAAVALQAVISDHPAWAAAVGEGRADINGRVLESYG